MDKKSFDVLMIDDETEILLFAGDLLRRYNFTVLTAFDADRAMTQLDENNVGVIILDVNLAGENGLTLMDFLKANHPDTPIILYTGLLHNDEQVMAMLKKGATCYVDKSQSAAELVFAVREVLSKSPGAKKPQS